MKLKLENQQGDKDMMDFGYGGAWLMILWAFLFIIFWGAVITLIIWAIRRYSGRSYTQQNPMDIARARYAKGEISKEQFEQIKKDLGG
jgi:putative membrane protein